MRLEVRDVNIVFVIFPNLTQLDFTGPLQVLHRIPGASIHILASTMDPVPSDCGLSLLPTGTFADAPRVDILCIPGGFGVGPAMRDQGLMDFVGRAGAEARYITSVCTGAFLLGAAGLLQGKKATTHWGYHALLAEQGAIPTEGRVVRDGNVITGGGVTAGIDFALALVREVVGEEAAQKIQIGLEYRPQAPEFPSFDSPVAESVVDYFQQRAVDFSHEMSLAVRPSAPGVEK